MKIESEISLPRTPWWVRAGAQAVRRLPAGRYRLMNALPRSPHPFLARLPEDKGGYWFECDLRDTIAREACYTGQYEPQETLLLCEMLGPGACFVDVGANWGYHTLLAAHRVGPGGRVISLEPDPRLFPVLQRNLERNNLGQVKALQVAAANCAGTLQLAGFDAAQGNYGVSRLTNGSGANIFHVAAQRLDEVLDEQGIEAVDLLKMDIEGAEGLALQGLADSLRRGRIRRLLLELHPAELAERGESATEIVALVAGYGYRGWKLDHSQAVTRRLAYARESHLADFVTAFARNEKLDAWPHFLWCAPGVEFMA